jgi:hypothetical protein
MRATWIVVEATFENAPCRLARSLVLEIRCAGYVLDTTKANWSSRIDLGFQTLPIVFEYMPAGRFFGFVWFCMPFLAAITSSLTMLQPSVGFPAPGSWHREACVGRDPRRDHRTRLAVRGVLQPRPRGTGHARRRPALRAAHCGFEAATPVHRAHQVTGLIAVTFLGFTLLVHRAGPRWRAESAKPPVDEASEVAES